MENVTAVPEEQNVPFFEAEKTWTAYDNVDDSCKDYVCLEILVVLYLYC